ncbi:Rta1 domain protein [Neofusicoccum parvum]|uniref:Rta1 domain protein n=1 Tax=Neofusicoccum parvum TaxID=310453 RepID=A0ACB5SA23_9PEZI|nr:Rta1 domain protein [Neofusicoccum parvum]GME45119.1 Rta1 domain protein [Neofusicoccum parvum]
MFKTRTWYLTAFVIGGFFELVGYAGRAVSASQDVGCWTMMPFIIQSIFLLVAPALFAASIYMILGRITLLTDGEQHSIIRRTWLTKFFVGGDIISFLMQTGGGGMMAKGSKVGEQLIVGGLFVQLFFFSFFVVVAGMFHRRMAMVPTSKACLPEVRWRHYLCTLYIVSLLVLVRSVFRVVEYLQGSDSFLMRTETFLYIFDALLMFAVMAWMNWFHPGEIGVLLRDGRPRTNGFALMKLG